MLARLTAHGVGAWAALAAPFWLTGHRWQTLLEAPPGLNSLPESAAASSATRTAWRALRVLARFPGTAWRYTCLYRGVTECLVLRHYRVAARLRIGVGREHPGEDGIIAHAWVVRPGESDAAAEPRAGSLRVLDGVV